MIHKIAIYTLSCNEEKNVLPWLENTRDADMIIVGDTGSTDHTVALLEDRGATVHHIRVSPWRFDKARNQLLNHIPDDVELCISLDFDERLSKGWRQEIEHAWKNGATRISYNYSEIASSDPNRVKRIISSRIHSRKDYKWIYPVHEMLSYCGSKKECQVHNKHINIVHKPDSSKNRTQYLELMKLAVKENPKNHRIVHQLGRDYMQYGYYDECIQTMEYALTLEDISPDMGRACIRFMARAYGEKKEYPKAKKYLLSIIKEAPYCCSAYIEHAILSYKFNQWEDIHYLAERCSAINFLYNTIYNELNYSTLFDIISITYFYRSDLKNALRYARKALEADKNNPRLKKNIELYQKMLKRSGKNK